MTEKTDAIFLLALLVLTIVGLAISSAAHAEELEHPHDVSSLIKSCYGA